jgi:hypothetical protein
MVHKYKSALWQQDCYKHPAKRQHWPGGKFCFCTARMVVVSAQFKRHILVQIHDTKYIVPTYSLRQWFSPGFRNTELTNLRFLECSEIL